MKEHPDARAERERILAIMQAHEHAGIDGHLYIRLVNLINNPDHDPRTIADEEAPFMGYHPRKPAKKRARRKK